MLLRSAPGIHLLIYLQIHLIYLKEPLTSYGRLMKNCKKPLNQYLTKLIQSTNHLFNTLPVTQPFFRTLESCLKGELRFATNSLPIILSNPPIIEPLQMILPDPVGETVVLASEQVAASEPSASAPAPKQTFTKTPEKATKSVPQKIELVNQPEPVAETAVPESVQVIDSEQTVTVTESEPNQQQPEQPHQPSPNQTTISTPTSNQPENQHSPQKAIPEPVVETIVSESVQVTESEQTVAITVSEPIQTTTQTIEAHLFFVIFFACFFVFTTLYSFYYIYTVV